MAEYWVIDTGVLVDAWLFQMASEGRTPWHQSLSGRLRAIRTTVAYDRLTARLRTRRVVTWNGVLVESGFVARRYLERTAVEDRRLWQLVRQAEAFMSKFAVVAEAKNERCRAVELGPTDSALVGITERLQREDNRATLLTLDRPLAQWCAAAGVPALYFDPAHADDFDR